jgi:hypothetical protein
MRKNIYQLISEMTCNPLEEIERLNFLFEEEDMQYGLSLKSYIDDLCFRDLPIRGTSLNIDDLKKRLGLHTGYSIDSLLSYCEFISNVLWQFDRHIQRQYSIPEKVRKQMKIIPNNIKWILERSNHKLIKLDDDKLIIVEKNRAAAQAASLTDDPNKALKIIEYNQIGLKGDLHGKQSILKQMGDVVEPILASHILKLNGYGGLESDAGFLLNKCQIRHENKSGKNKKDYISRIDDATLEYLYDKTYNTLLMVIMTNEQHEVSNEIKALKEQYKW